MNKSDPWAEYARVQKDTNWNFLSDRTEAAEETLDVILEKVRAGQAISGRQVDNLLINRAKKVRHRRSLLARNACLLSRSVDEEQRFVNRMALYQCLRNCDIRSCRMLLLAAIGCDYSCIAARERVSEAAIKTRIHRARLKLKRLAGVQRRTRWGHRGGPG